MATYAETCAAILSITPATTGGLVIAETVAVVVTITPQARGARAPGYTAADGSVVSSYIAEKHRGRSLKQTANGRKYVREFLIHGSQDPTACEDFGPQIGEAAPNNPKLVVVDRELTTYAAGGGEADVVLLTVEYAEIEQQASGGGNDPSFSYSIAAEQEHVDLALEQTHYGKAPKTGEELLINFDGETVGGLDIGSPILEWTEEHRLTEEEFNPSFRKTLRDLIHTVNNADFREYEAGEVLFVNAAAEKRGKRWSVSFTFRARRNEQNKPFTVVNDAGGEEAKQVDKAGWDYLWVSFGTRKQGETSVRKVPIAIHVAQVYRRANFATFGIGTAPLK